MSDDTSKDGATKFEDIEGGGIGDGEGVKDVSDQIESEEQVLAVVLDVWRCCSLITSDSALKYVHLLNIISCMHSCFYCFLLFFKNFFYHAVNLFMYC